MNIKPKAEETNYESNHYCGLETFTIIKVNPNKKELNAMYGKSDDDSDEEIEYITEKDGVDRIRISIFLKGEETKRITRVNFFISDKERVFKVKEGEDESKPKYQFINQVCQSAPGTSADTLPDWFTKFTDKDKNVIGKKTFRKALEGESDFYDFVRNVMQKADFFDPETEIRFDMKKFRKNDFSQLNSVLTDPSFTVPFVALNYIKLSLDGDKEYNEVFTKALLSVNIYNKVVPLMETYYDAIKDTVSESPKFKDMAVITGSDVYGYVDSPTISLKKEYENKQWSKFYDEVTGPYGCKGFFKICPVFEYNKDMNPISGNSPLTTSDY